MEIIYLSGIMTSLLDILTDTGAKTPENLTALLHISPGELADEINKLLESGVPLCCDNNQIRLAAQLPLLDRNKLTQALQPYSVIYQPMVDSTNQYLLEHCSELTKGTICVTEMQTAGRGRRGRQWISPFAGQLILSFYWTLNPRNAISGLSLVVGMAIVEALEKAGMDGIKLKWPNDLLFKGKKLAGILIEIASVRNQLINIVGGIGINLKLPKIAGQISQPWSELAEITPHFDRTELIIAIVKSVYTYLNDFAHNGITDAFRQKWERYDEYSNEEVNVITEKKIISGVNMGISRDGSLMIRDEEGHTIRFNGGEVSLRKK
ncbi:bifunctional biotin--[acetyl-CoA-carboxylase] ligase/biotin operon repressor BirA [Pasteurellaceae bacterium LIM206]|nr:bifunctional biotin--[acetyl-CoA-carboxylase] ligase/biotin operon repressor BirA [Pasteurellaceae bacterium LIM206]